MAARGPLIHNACMLDDDRPTDRPTPLAAEPDAQCHSAEQLAARCAQSLRDWTARGSEYAARLGKAALPYPQLVFDLRGHNAGEFVANARRYAQPCVRINRELLQRYPRHMIEQVVPHEVAHYVVWATARRGTLPHGPEWRAVMAFFGKPADVSHRMVVKPARRVRKLPFRCACVGTSPQFSRVILKRHLRGTRYYCRRCREQLLPTEAALLAYRAGD